MCQECAESAEKESKQIIPIFLLCAIPAGIVAAWGLYRPIPHPSFSDIATVFFNVLGCALASYTGFAIAWAFFKNKFSSGSTVKKIILFLALAVAGTFIVLLKRRAD